MPEAADHIVCVPDEGDVKTVEDYVKKVAQIPKQAELACINLEFSAPEQQQFGNLFQAGRLDNLASVYASVIALIRSLQQSPTSVQTRMIFAFNNEEVGSGTRAGAEGPMIQNWWKRLCSLGDVTSEEAVASFTRSFTASADGGHAKHPIKGA